MVTIKFILSLFPHHGPESESNTRQAPNVGRFSIWRVDLVRLSAPLVCKMYQNSHAIKKNNYPDSL